MSLESRVGPEPAGEQEIELEQEPRDRTKWIWAAVIAVFAVMVVALWLSQRPTDLISTVRAKHILIQANMNDPVERQRALATAKTLRERILKGESFEKLAREYSNDPWSSQRGGDLGYAKKGTYEEAFEAYIWNPQTPLNQVGDIVRTGHGYHIIVVVDRRLSAADKYEQELRRRGRPAASEDNSQGSAPAEAAQ